MAVLGSGIDLDAVNLRRRGVGQGGAGAEDADAVAGLAQALGEIECAGGAGLIGQAQRRVEDEDVQTVPRCIALRRHIRHGAVIQASWRGC